MEKGLLHKKTFKLNSPTLKQDVETFTKELKERMQKFQITQFVVLQKKTPETLEILIIPSAGSLKGQGDKAVQAFLTEGFQETSLDELQKYSKSDMTPTMVKFGKD